MPSAHSPGAQFRMYDRQVLVSISPGYRVIPPDASGDMFGQIYQYFLAKFALAEALVC
ncbi:MAG: hypothetical protein ACFCVD_05420 [Nodosilinea sp.]